MHPFSNALADTRLLITNFPSEEYDCLRLGKTYLAHVSLDHTLYIFSRALTHCPDSKPLAEALTETERFKPSHESSHGITGLDHASCEGPLTNLIGEAGDPGAVQFERNSRVVPSQNLNLKDRVTVPPIPSSSSRGFENQNRIDRDISLDLNNI